MVAEHLVVQVRLRQVTLPRPLAEVAFGRLRSAFAATRLAPDSSVASSRARLAPLQQPTAIVSPVVEQDPQRAKQHLEWQANTERSFGEPAEADQQGFGYLVEVLPQVATGSLLALAPPVHSAY